MNQPALRAYLTGSALAPAFALYFPWGARHAASGLELSEWIKKAPGRRWDPERKSWLLTGLGPDKNPEALLAKAGFHLDLSSGAPGEALDMSLAGIFDLRELIAPRVVRSPESRRTVFVYPRMAGYDHVADLLGAGAEWNKNHNRFEVPITDLLLHGEPRHGLHIDSRILVDAREFLKEHAGPRVTSDRYDAATIAADTAAMAASAGLGDAHDEDALNRLVDVVGDFPTWFGMTPRPYQRVGALALIAGHSVMADPTGLGKTIQLIGAIQVRQAKRAIVICPPIVVTHWGREIERCGVAFTPPKPLTKKQLRELEKAKKEAAAPAEVTAAPYAATGFEPSVAPPTQDTSAPSGHPGTTILPAGTPESTFPASQTRRTLAVFSATRKEPDLPDEGVVVVPDSLLASRPALRAKLIEWGADAIAYDEAHRARNWTSKRAEAAMALYDNLRPGALRIVSTATPIFSAPHDLAPLLAMTGHLDSVFGGKSAYYERYTKRNHFNQIVSRKENLPELHELLRKHVWVRRKKEEVLPDLPLKSRDAMYVDVDLKGFRAAHNEVIDKVMLWLDEQYAQLGHLPNEETAEKWARTQIGLMSPLRKAAGLAKVPAALDEIADWIDAETSYDAHGNLLPVDRPLIVWAHHHEVFDALKAGVAEKFSKGNMVGLIDGALTPQRRGAIADEFQAGRIPVLLCSISAAGVGITLTRSSDVLFVESDYSVPNVSQAEDRVHRIGQEHPVQIRTMVATGTLDARLHDILATKSETIDAVTGDDSGVHVQVADSGLSPSAIIVELVTEAAKKWKPAAQRLAEAP